MDSDDANFRPLKRQRPDIELAPIPPDKLLLALPYLLLHPPTHRQHLQGVALAQHALRRCLALPGIDRAIECRAWTALAELGLGCLQSGQHGVEGEIEKALTKAVSPIHCWCRYPARTMMWNVLFKLCQLDRPVVDVCVVRLTVFRIPHYIDIMGY